MCLLVVAAFGVLGWGFWQRVRVYRRGQPVECRDDLPGRIQVALRQVLAQQNVVRVRGAGSAHGLFFYAFLLLTIGTTLIFIQADLLDPLFGIKILKGNFYLIFSLVLDLAGLVAVVMLLGLLARRYLVRPAGLPTTRDNALMLALLLAILLTGFFVEGARMAATELGTSLAYWSPVGLLVAMGLAGATEASRRALHIAGWWLHFALVLGFFVAVPVTRFRHLLTTCVNYVFTERRRKGSLTTLDLEDDSIEHFGAGRLADLTWKDLLDGDACTHCKRCQDRCPAWATDKPLSPMKLVNQIQELSFAKKPAETAGLIETVTSDALWSCTTCRACQEICPATIEHVPKIVDMRRNQVLMEGEFPGEEVQKAIENTEVNGNPLGIGYSGRGDWVEGLGIATFEEDSEVDILYFAGCYASFDKRNIKVAKAFIRFCQAAGVKVGILGKEEKCCGEPMRKIGNEYLYQTLAAENIALINGYGIKQIVTSCPHCFQTLDNDYRVLGLEASVQHYSVYLDELRKSVRLQFIAAGIDCTYHDSCYLGRYNNFFESPRNLIQAAGGSLVEMEKNKLESFCCGAGGGRILAEEKLGSRISEARATMASRAGVPVLISNCPFCLTMFEDGIKGAGFEERLVPKDLAELLAERL
jgi:Fe-S oxidoreductase/nitrate reductase gamma subunit